MKHFIHILVAFITLSLHAQEKMSLNLLGENIEFTISNDEIFVEYKTVERTIIQQKIKDNFTELHGNSAILKIKSLIGNYEKRKLNLKETIFSDFERIEPVLIYKDGTRQIAKGELNIKLHSSSFLNEIFKGIHFTYEPNEFQDNLFLVKVNLETSDLFELINQLQNDNRVEFAEPNFIRLIKPNTDDTFFDNQWSINNQGYLGGTVDADMDVEEAWAFSTGDGIVVAVIDEGVDLTHPDLTENLLPGFDATGNNSNGAPNEENNDAHGTACAGIIAAVANNEIGTVGVSYDARLLPIRIGFSNGLPLGDINRRWITSDNWVANGINWAWQNGADILSNSWGGGSSSNTITTAINSAVNDGRDGKGAIVLFSTGNNNGNVFYPAILENVIAVGASSMCDERKSPTSCDNESWWGSNFGNEIDVVAPGVEIWTSDISGANGYTNGDDDPDFNGTSSACPNTAGVVALILSANPNLTQQEAREILERNTDKIDGYVYSDTSGHPNGIWNNEVGYGRVNAFAAVQEAVASLTPTLTGPSLLCTSDTSFTLSGVPTGQTVSWSVSSNLQLVSSNATGATVRAVSSSTSGSATLTATLSNGVEVAQVVWVGSPGAITELSHPTTFGCTKGELDVMSSGGQHQYQWVISGGKIVIPSINTNTYTGNGVIFVEPTGTQRIRVRVRAINSCGESGWHTEYIPVNCPYGGEGGATPLIAIFDLLPNPTKGLFTLHTHRIDKHSAQTTVQLTVYDLHGQVRLQQSVSPGSSIDSSQLKAGMYLVQIQHAHGQETHQLVVE